MEFRLLAADLGVMFLTSGVVATRYFFCFVQHAVRNRLGLIIQNGAKEQKRKIKVVPKTCIVVKEGPSGALFSFVSLCRYK